MNHRTALGALHIGALFFGLSGVFGKLASASAVVIVMGRAAFAVLALVGFVGLARRGWHPLERQDWARLLVAGGLLAGHWVTFFMAVKVAGVAVATLGFASFPAFTVLLESMVFRERIRRNEIILVALVSMGLILVTPTFDLASQATSGLLWAIFSGLTFAVLSLVNRSSGKRVPPVQAALCQNAVVTLCVLPWAWPQLASVSAMDWWWIGLLGVFCTGVAHSLFVASLAVIKARTAAVVFALEPVYGIAFAWMIFSEMPTMRMLAGGVLIVVAIVLSSRKTA